MKRTSKELLVSRPLDVHRYSEYPEVKACVDEVFKRILSENVISSNSKKTKKALLVVILDLYIAWKHNPEVFVAYSRDRNKYVAGSRYNSLHISRDPLRSAIDGLIKLDLVDHAKGVYFRNKKGPTKGYHSRMKIKPELIDLIEKVHKIKPKMVSINPDFELIKIKDQNKKLVEYKDNHQTHRMRDFLKEYNEFLDLHLISLRVDEQGWQELHAELSANKKDSKTKVCRTTD